MSAQYTSSNALTLQEVLARLESGELCSMTVIKYDAQRKTGGEEMEILQAKLLVKDDVHGQSCATTGPQKSAPPQEADDDTNLDPDIEFGPGDNVIEDEILDEERQRKNPNHYKWFTRNLRLYSAGQPTSRKVKIHPPLIIKFDGREVI